MMSLLSLSGLILLNTNCSKWVIWMWNVSNYHNVAKYTCGYGLMTYVDLRGNDFIHPYENPCHTSWLWEIIPLKLVLHDMMGKYWHDVTKVQFGENYLN